ncbi:MAG: pimeloyl-CoA dehydrogenase large subunit [Burkholderiales bacterium]|jgi:alkylation response protein AidB-like acyl-CoA dehydrogenase|nr:pimeloyl-CoA dehydrogenase large subunit [Burkholderiales bacterium]
MDIDLCPEYADFCAEVRGFLSAALPVDIRRKVLRGSRLEKGDFVRWQRILHAQGWAAPNWPEPFGGTGWNAVQQALFDEECALAGAPRQLPFGLKMLAPVLMRFGSEAQRRDLLPDIASGTVWWCQGYSEPGSGSDLASLKTRALRDGEDYIVTGQKTWTTLGQYADWMFCLVRTDVATKPQQGISFLLIDMRSPGVTLRPIITLDGEHEVNEVWFDEVRVPVANRVGEENQGWTIAKYLLGHERSNIAGVGIVKRELARLKDIVARTDANGQRLRGDALFAVRVAQIEIDLLALEATQLRMLQRDGPPGPESSMLKVLGSELQQRLSELLMHAAGQRALPFAPAAEGVEAPAAMAETEDQGDDLLAAQYANWRKLSIFGGSNEIQKNILARALGL